MKIFLEWFESLTSKQRTIVTIVAILVLIGVFQAVI